jgi:predicted ATPase/DNA-binding winged helix-turn-helix (wHTH) protein
MLTGMSQPDLTFGRVALSLRPRLLQIDGKQIKLGSRAFDILAALAENIGVTIDKNTLIKRAWPDMSVEEGALRVHVVAIRKALTTVPDLAIEAIPGQGYRLNFRGAAISPGPIAASLVGLPMVLPTIFGRETFIQAIVDEVGRGTLTTVVGPGGIGKTTVAIAACHRGMANYRSGICFVDFGAIAEPSIVADTLARQLGLGVFSRNPIQGILWHLRDKHMLLVFDTCEHVVEAAADLAERVLVGAPGVRILATSREPLRAAGESVLRLPPLELPSGKTLATLEQATTFPATAMFVDRVLGSGGWLWDRDSTSLAEICGKLDGVPLAIEIAAAHVGVLGLQAVESQIGTRFALAAKGRRTSLSRHQTLQSTLDWSYGLLTTDEQSALRALSVFATAFTLVGATSVIDSDLSKAAAAPNIIADLVSKSLVTIVGGEVRRYKLLDTTRRYAREALRASGAENVIAERHARFCTTSLIEAEQRAGELSGPEWLENYDGLLEEARAALAWCNSPAGDKSLGVALTVASVQLWTRHALLEEHREIIEQAIAHLADLHLLGTDVELRLRLAQGNILYHGGGIALDAATDAAFVRALGLAKAIGTPADQIRALTGINAQGISRGDYAGCQEYESDFMEAGKGPLAPIASRSVAHNLLYMGRLREAREILRPAIEYGTATPTPAGSGVQFAHKSLVDTVRARMVWLEGRPDDAIGIASDAVETALTIASPISLCLTLATGALFVSSMNGDRPLTERFIAMLDHHATRHSMRRWREYAAGYRLALIPHAERTPAEITQFADHVSESNGALLESLAVLGNDRTTPELIAKALDGHAGWCRAELMRAKADYLFASGAVGLPEARSKLTEALAMAEAQGARAWSLRIGTSLALLLEREKCWDDAIDLLGPIVDRFDRRGTAVDLAVARNLLSRLSNRVN